VDKSMGEMRRLQTVKGDINPDALGLMLPHEHLFVDLRGPNAPAYAQANPDTVAQVMRPFLAAAEAAGVTAFVDCAPVGVGRNVAVLRHIADTTSIHIVAPTGRYREGLIPVDLIGLSAEALAERWIIELTEGMEGTDSRAGFIKIGMSDNGPTLLEIISLKAAVLASRKTGAVIASHTIGGAVARRELDILEAEGHDLRRFIWVHAHTEPDSAIHIEAARRGAYVEFDAVGAEHWHPQASLLDSVVHLLQAGYAEHILLSHDAGWYDPAQPDGQPQPGGIRAYTALTEQFIPSLQKRGVDDETLHLLTVLNPASAFALSDGGI
jgi:phosphotriesterase-related protein